MSSASRSPCLAQRSVSTPRTRRYLGLHVSALVLALRAPSGALVRSSSIGTLWTTLSQKGLAARRAYGVCRPYVLCAAKSGSLLVRSPSRDADASNASWIIARNGEDTPSARARLERPSRATARSARKSRSRAAPTRCRARAGGVFCARAVEGLDSKLPSQCTPSRCPRGRAAGTLVHGHVASIRRPLGIWAQNEACLESALGGPPNATSIAS